MVHYGDLLRVMILVASDASAREGVVLAEDDNTAITRNVAFHEVLQYIRQHTGQRTREVAYGCLPQKAATTVHAQ